MKVLTFPCLAPDCQSGQQYSKIFLTMRLCEYGKSGTCLEHDENLQYFLSRVLRGLIMDFMREDH